MIDLDAIQKTIAAHYSKQLSDVSRVLAYMPGAPEAGTAYVWQAEQWLEPEDDEATFCRTVQASYTVEILASMTDTRYSQEWLAGVVSELLSAPVVDLGDGEICYPVRAPRLRRVQSENGQLFLNASITLTPITLEAD